MFCLRAQGPLRKAEVYGVTFRVDPSRGRIGPERMSRPAMLRQCYLGSGREIREITGPGMDKRRVPDATYSRGRFCALAAASCGGESSTEPDEHADRGAGLALLEVAIGQGLGGRRRDVRERDHDP